MFFWSYHDPFLLLDDFGSSSGYHQPSDDASLVRGIMCSLVLLDATLYHPRMARDKSKAKEIGRRIKQARLEAGGMTQRELGDLLGVTERSVAAYETGEVVPYRFLRDLERVLGAEAAWILHGEEATRTQEARQLDEVMTLLRELRAAVDALKDGS